MKLNISLSLLNDEIPHVIQPGSILLTLISAAYLSVNIGLETTSWTHMTDQEQ